MKKRKGFSIMMAVLLALSVGIAPVAAKEVTTPYSKEDASISLSVYNTDKTTEGKGKILVKNDSKSFNVPGDYYKLEAAPENGYVFARWKLNISLKMKDSTINSKGSQFSFREPGTGKTGYAFENGEGAGIYAETSPSLRVKRISLDGLGDVEKILYTVEAYFTPKTDVSSGTQPTLTVTATPTPTLTATPTSTPTPTPTAAPATPSSGQPVIVDVNYLYNGSTVFGGEPKKYTETGTYTICADSELLDRYGFALENSAKEAKTVKVADNGKGRLTADPDSADFQLTPDINPAAYSFDVNYEDRNGNSVGESRSVTFRKTGGYDIHDIPVPTGYHRVEVQGEGTDSQYPVSLVFKELSWKAVPQSLTLTVEKSQGNLTAKPDSVTFTVQPSDVREPVKVKVRYLYGEKEISTENVTYDKEGRYTVSADSKYYEEYGFCLDEKQNRNQEVAVTKGNGGKLEASPKELDFRVTPAVDPGAVPFQAVYIHAGDKSVIKESTLHFEKIGPCYYDKIPIPEGYRLALSGGRGGSDVAAVTLEYAQGEWKADTESVEVPLVQNSVDVAVEFQLKDGAALSGNSSSVIYRDQGEKTIKAKVPSGYQIVGSEEQTVTVSTDSDGNLLANPGTVIFKVKKITASGTPNTGDEPPILFYSLIGVAALLGGSGVVITKRRKFSKK